MEQIQIRLKSLECALDIFMTEYPRDISSEDVFEHMNNCADSQQKLKDDYVIWQPFETWPLSDLVEWIDNAANSIELTIRGIIHES